MKWKCEVESIAQDKFALKRYPEPQSFGHGKDEGTQDIHMISEDQVLGSVLIKELNINQVLSQVCDSI